MHRLLRVLKPAEQTPLSAIRLGQLAADAGLPPGVVNVVPGFGETAGQAVGRHGDVDNAGQVCNAGSRLIVDRSIGDELLDRLVVAAEPWRPGNPFRPETRMGAIVDETQLGRVLSYIEAGKNEGARLATGGNQALTDTGGYYVEPTIFADASNEMTIAREEIFGPVLTVISIDDPERAVAIANDTQYGLAAAVWTRDISRAHRIARALRAGNVYVNTYDRGDISLPFATFKQSGVGVDKSLHAIDKYVRLKTTWISL